MSAGSAAWRLLGAEAWRLLDSGRLRNAARLSAALSAVGGSMPALLLSCRPPDRAAPTPLSIARGAITAPLLECILSCTVLSGNLTECGTVTHRNHAHCLRWTQCPPVSVHPSYAVSSEIF